MDPYTPEFITQISLLPCHVSSLTSNHGMKACEVQSTGLLSSLLWLSEGVSWLESSNVSMFSPFSPTKVYAESNACKLGVLDPLGAMTFRPPPAE